MRGLLAGLLVLVAVGAPAAWVVVHNEAANRVEAVFEAAAAPGGVRRCGLEPGLSASRWRGWRR